MLYSGLRAQEAWDVGRGGERAAVILSEYGAAVIDAPRTDLIRGTVGQTLADAVARWAERIRVVSRMEVSSQSKHGTELRVAAAFSAHGADEPQVEADLVNVGIGVSQVLPVLVLCLAAPPGSTVLLEQPELHLHPAVQSRLGDFFAACALSGRQIVIETHSEHLINRFRLLVARGQLDPEVDVSLNFIERDDYGSDVEEIKIGPDGTLGRWPRGFFDESERALQEIMQERMS